MKDYLKRQFDIFNQKENEKLEKLNVMIAGAGGLGTHQAQQLLRMGINKIYLYDNDVVEISNLNRQLFYGKDDIGKHKVDIAKKHLDRFGLSTEIVARHATINQNTSIPDDVHLIFDALDNFETRFILEDLAIEAEIPFIHGGIESWYGQIAVIIPGKTARLKDIFSGADKDNRTPSIISPAVSVIASIQILEGIKVYLDMANFLKNKLLLVDLDSCTVEKVNIKSTESDQTY